MESRRILDPLERSCEVLFGVIVVLTFTGTISVTQGGEAETRTILAAAIGCNLAWGIVDGAMYLLSTYAERARMLSAVVTVRRSREPGAAQAVIREALPPLVAAVLTEAEVDGLRQRLAALPEPPPQVSLTRRDYAGALAVCLLVFLSTFPIVIPFFVMQEPARALRTSNLVALVMLFVTGWSLGRYTGRSGWLTGVGLAILGVLLVITTMALGG